MGGSLVLRLLPRKAERGFGVLSDISCHMGWVKWHKECNYCILHLGLELLRLLHGMVYKSLIRSQSFLGKLRMSCEVSFFYLQFSLKYDHFVMHTQLRVLESDSSSQIGELPCPM